MENNNSTRNLKRSTKEDRICVICEDESDGFHFGRPTCRACAAFFRRTVRQKLQYSCMREETCEIEKGARNMCRFCRFKKCLGQGMLPSAVQKARKYEGMESNSSSSAAGNLPQFLSNSIQSNSTSDEPSSTSTSNSSQSQFKHLHRLLNAYHQYLSLRNASNSMLNDLNLRRIPGEELPLSHFDNFTKICQIIVSLEYDIVCRFFLPFTHLPAADKAILFDFFAPLFCYADRAFRSLRMFGPGDQRLIMPDGGIVRPNELHLFFKDSKKVKGNPKHVARIFHNTLQYLLTNVLVHMRNIDIQEMELATLFGMFLWRDSHEIMPQSLQIAMQVRNEIIVDLHRYYRSLGLADEEITLKTANLFLLIPKFENVVKMMLEDANITELFDMLRIDGPCKGI